jgi:two-component system, NarL family, response regulator NreC
MADVTILIADDHGILRAGLRALIEAEPGYKIVGEAADGEEVLRLSAHLQPDIVLMDISMPGQSGLEATRQLKEKQPDIKVLILTVHEDKALLKEAIKVGASGYLLKRALKNDLFQAIHAVLRNELYLHSAMIRPFLEETVLEAKSPATGLETLTRREIEVLRLIAQGFTNSQIAEKLAVSLRTVEYHRGNLTNKLKMHSRVDLFRFASEHGLANLSETDSTS